MNVEVLRYFVELANVGSFYGAAKGLFMSQQGLNKAISSLEEELNVKLVERGRRGVKLTAEGERFLAFAQRVSEEYIDYLGGLYASNARERSLSDDALTLRVSYYASQVAASSRARIGALVDTVYLEEPFEKILHRVKSSDGSELVFVDLHANTAADVLSDPDLAFESLIATRIGIVCRDDSPLAHMSSVRRGDIAHLPCAINSHREMAQVLEWVFRDNPLSDVRVGSSNPRMLLSYVRDSKEGIGLYDSFGFYLAGHDDAKRTEGLRFIPLSTPEALCFVGFLSLKHVRPKPRVLLASNILSKYISQTYADYLERNPVSPS